MSGPLGSVFWIDALPTKFVGVKKFQVFAASFRTWGVFGRELESVVELFPEEFLPCDSGPHSPAASF